MANIGSLNLFIQDLPDNNKYWKGLDRMRRSEMETRTSTSPKSFKRLRAKSRMTVQSKSTPFRIKRKEIVIKKRSENKSLRKLSPGDQLRAELM